MIKRLLDIYLNAIDNADRKIKLELWMENVRIYSDEGWNSANKCVNMSHVENENKHE